MAQGAASIPRQAAITKVEECEEVKRKFLEQFTENLKGMIGNPPGDADAIRVWNNAPPTKQESQKRLVYAEGAKVKPLANRGEADNKADRDRRHDMATLERPSIQTRLEEERAKKKERDARAHSAKKMAAGLVRPGGGKGGAPGLTDPCDKYLDRAAFTKEHGVETDESFDPKACLPPLTDLVA